MPDPGLFPDPALTSFTVTTGANSVTLDSVASGTGWQVFEVVNETNAVVNIPPFTPGTFNPVTVTFLGARSESAGRFHIAGGKHVPRGKYPCAMRDDYRGGSKAQSPMDRHRHHTAFHRTVKESARRNEMAPSACL